MIVDELRVHVVVSLTRIQSCLGVVRSRSKVGSQYEEVNVDRLKMNLDASAQGPYFRMQAFKQALHVKENVLF